MNNKDTKLYNLEFSKREKYLYAYVSGDKDSIDISRNYWNEIAEECRQTNCNKVLIIEDIKEIVSTTEMYQIASEIPSMGFYGVRIAFVDRYIEQHTLNEFGEIIATNRGIHGKIFNNIDEAEEWLLSD